MAASSNWFVEEFVPGGDTTVKWLKSWLSGNWYWFLVSGLIHGIGFLVAAILAVLIPMAIHSADDAPWFDSVDPATLNASSDIPKYGEGSLEPSELSTATLSLDDPPAQTAKYYDDSESFVEAGGGTLTSASGMNFGGMGFRGDAEAGPGGLGGVGNSPGFGHDFGVGGDERGFGGRGQGHREAMLGSTGGTKAGERAVAAALNWFYRHQNVNGGWSLQHSARCRGDRCSGQGSVHADSAATGMALLPFLAAGQTHLSKGPYQNTIHRGVSWLLKQQRADGNLAPGVGQPMYSHALAAIALCEAYGLSKDETLRPAAQKAVHFIERAQNRQTGGWRYNPGDTGDTSVVGWQVMALESAQMAQLAVDTQALENVRTWLKSVAKGNYGGLYAYLPHREVTPTTTAIGMLCQQYLGARRNDPGLQEGMEYLLTYAPSAESERNTYYWYYGTLVMHNMLGPEWDNWNRKMRRVLIKSQAREDCATGSWDPEQPSMDTWGGQGGRVMTTSFATLSLEVYYRYLPLFKIESAPSERSSESDDHMAMRRAEK